MWEFFFSRGIWSNERLPRNNDNSLYFKSSSFFTSYYFFKK